MPLTSSFTVWWTNSSARVPSSNTAPLSNTHWCDWLWLFSIYSVCCWHSIIIWTTTGESVSGIIGYRKPFATHIHFHFVKQHTRLMLWYVCNVKMYNYNYMCRYAHMFIIISLQISYTPSSSRHFDRDAVNSGGPYELYPSNNNLVHALVSVMRSFKWSQISIITQNEYPFLKVWINMVCIFIEVDESVIMH